MKNDTCYNFDTVFTNIDICQGLQVFDIELFRQRDKETKRHRQRSCRFKVQMRCRALKVHGLKILKLLRKIHLTNFPRSGSFIDFYTKRIKSTKSANLLEENKKIRENLWKSVGNYSPPLGEPEGTLSRRGAPLLRPELHGQLAILFLEAAGEVAGSAEAHLVGNLRHRLRGTVQ